MIITDIQQQKKNQKRYSVFIDGEFAFGISDVDLLFYNLKKGKEITAQQLDYITENLLYEKAKEKAFNKLNYRSCTRKEIEEKLQEDYSSQIIERVLEMLERYNYINDRQYAQLYIKDSINLKGWGRLKIRFQLKQKGISEEIINAYLEEHNEEYPEKAFKLLSKKFKGADISDYKIKQKAYTYLSQRGYTYNDIEPAIELYNEEYNL